MNKLLLASAVPLLVLIGGVRAFSRAPAPAPAPPLRRPAPPPVPADPPEAVDERRTRSEFWEALDAGHATTSKTAEFLGLQGRFEAAASRAAADIARAWEVRNQAIEGLSEGMSSEQRALREQAIQDRYVADKRAALALVEDVLGPDPRHQWFRARMEEWFDFLR